MKDSVRALSALAHENRLAVFRLLVAAGPAGMTPGALGERLTLPPATLSFHLRSLVHANLVESRQDGRFLIYTAQFGTMNALIAYLTDHCCSGDPAACGLPAVKLAGAAAAKGGRARLKT